MAYRLTYTSTRPDTTKDWYFFAEDADSGFETNGTHFRNWLDARSDVTVTLEVAEDNLSFKWELDFADEAAYDAFVVDRDAARLFYEVNLYYAAFGQEFNRGTAEIGRFMKSR